MHTLASSRSTVQVMDSRMAPQTNHDSMAIVNALSLPILGTTTLTKAGPRALPISPKMFKIPKAIPRVDGRVTFLGDHRWTVETARTGLHFQT